MITFGATRERLTRGQIERTEDLLQLRFHLLRFNQHTLHTAPPRQFDIACQQDAIFCTRDTHEFRIVSVRKISRIVTQQTQPSG